MGFAGSNPLRFLKQLDDYGLKGKIAVLGNTTSTDEGILKLMGEEAVDTFTAGWYAAGLDTADNKKFVAGINADYQHDPGFYTAGPYTALLIIEEALKAIGGKTDDAAAFILGSRLLAARSCRSSGLRSTHPNTRLILRRSNRTLTRSIRALPVANRCAFSSSSTILG